MKKLLLISIFLGILFAGSAQVIEHLQPKEFSEAVETDKVVLLDVRTPKEFAQGHIAGAKNISSSDPELHDKLGAFDHNTPIYIYCYSGGRSRSVAAYLESQKFTKIYNLDKGFMSWKKAKLDVVVESTKKTKEKEFTFTSFESLLKENQLVLIDFYAPWCGPCKQMMPMIHEMKTAGKGVYHVETINVDANPLLVDHFSLTSIPRLMIFKNGEKVWDHQGTITKKDLEQVIANI